MKAKKWVTFTTAGISAISLICSVIANCVCIDLMYDISMAIFGSALLGFIMSLIEYFAERRKAMEAFITASSKVISQLRKIKHIDVCEEEKTHFLNCLKEEQHNFYVESLGTDSAKSLGMKIEYKKRNAYIAWIESSEFPPCSEEDLKNEFFLQIYNQRMNKHKSEIKSHMDIYLGLAEISLEELDFTYGNLDFLFWNRGVRNRAYISIYSCLHDYVNKIRFEAVQFKILKDGNGNEAVCADKIFQLNDFFLELSKEQSDGREIINVYQKLFDDICDEITYFRKKTYFKNKDIISPNHTPVFMQYKRNDTITLKPGESFDVTIGTK